MPFHTHDSTRLYWQVDGEGPASHVLIHGLGLDRGMWFAVAPALAVEERVLTVDLPGHGAVRADDDAAHGALTVEALAAALHAIMAAAAMPRAHVCGQDLGAAVAPANKLSLTLWQNDIELKNFQVIFVYMGVGSLVTIAITNQPPSPVQI